MLHWNIFKNNNQQWKKSLIGCQRIIRPRHSKSIILKRRWRCLNQDLYGNENKIEIIETTSLNQITDTSPSIISISRNQRLLFPSSQSLFHVSLNLFKLNLWNSSFGMIFSPRKRVKTPQPLFLGMKITHHFYEIIGSVEAHACAAKLKIIESCKLNNSGRVHV